MNLLRWNDDRLDDLAGQVRHINLELQKITDVKTELAALKLQVMAIGTDSQECGDDVKALRLDLEKRAQVQHEERRADRKWLIATLLSTAGLIIAALAIFLG
jgi:hypothetical protein